MSRNLFNSTLKKNDTTFFKVSGSKQLILATFNKKKYVES